MFFALAFLRLAFSCSLITPTFFVHRSAQLAILLAGLVLLVGVAVFAEKHSIRVKPGMEVSASFFPSS